MTIHLPTLSPFEIEELNRQWLARVASERDPNGLDPHAPGAKLDASKVSAALLRDFSLALSAVAEVCHFGAAKYSKGGWQHVDNAIERYDNAAWRHMLAERHESHDRDSGLHHASHEAWNKLARLELMLRSSTAGAQPGPADVSPQHETGIKPDAGKPAVLAPRGKRDW